MSSQSGFLSSLSLGTIVIIILIASILLALFLRKRGNRHPMEGTRERNVAEDLDAGRGPEDGAGPRG